jgi:O-antigen ligase
MVVRFKAIQTGWRVGAVAVLGMLIIATASQSWWERMDSILHPQTDYNVAGTYGRLQVWKRGIGYMIQRPLTGVGYANFPVAEGTLFALAVERGAHGKGSKWGVAHNSYIEVGAELGLPGLVCYLGLLLAAFAGLRSVRAFPGGPRDPPNLARALTASLLGFVVGAFFLSLEYSDLAFALCAFATALAKTTRLARVPKYARPRFRMAR